MAEGSPGPALLKEDEKGGGARTALSLSPQRHILLPWAGTEAPNGLYGFPRAHATTAD